MPPPARGIPENRLPINITPLTHTPSNSSHRIRSACPSAYTSRFHSAEPSAATATSPPMSFQSQPTKITSPAFSKISPTPINSPRISDARSKTPSIPSILAEALHPSLIPSSYCASSLPHATNFDVASDAEITVECAPGTLSPTLIDTLLQCGVNRISLGVQSFVDQEAQSVGACTNAQPFSKKSADCSRPASPTSIST